jgi:hypothetical protein
MNLPGVVSVADDTVTIQAWADHPTSARLEFQGVLGHREPKLILELLFRQVHDAMLSQRRNLLTMDLRELRFMNSSSFKHFVALVKQNEGLGPGQRYEIEFLLNPAHHWQEVSIHALRCFSMDSIKVHLGKPTA